MVLMGISLAKVPTMQDFGKRSPYLAAVLLEIDMYLSDEESSTRS